MLTVFNNLICQDMGQGPYDVVAVTDKPERAHALFSSVHWPVRVRLLQPPPGQRPWKYRWFDTERYLLNLAFDFICRFFMIPHSASPWSGNFSLYHYHCHIFSLLGRARLMRSYVTRLRESGLGRRLVIYADAFDTAYMGCQRDLHKEHAVRFVVLTCSIDVKPLGLVHDMDFAFCSIQSFSWCGEVL